MNKVNELEYRWKAYKYKTVIFYLFIAVFVAFIIALGFFIVQISGMNAPKSNSAQVSATPNHANANRVNPANPQNGANLANPANQSGVNPANAIPPNPANQNAPIPANPQNLAIPANPQSANQVANQANPQNLTAIPTHTAIRFTCRQVTANSLTVRANSSLQSRALGTYPLDSIFCASESENGMLKTPNGWVSANDKYSEVVDVNMFVDVGFQQYQNNSAKKSQVEEVKLFDKPIAQGIKPESTKPKAIAQNVAQAPIVAPKPKTPINISSSKTTKDKLIEFKKADFKSSNSYEAAIEVARFYYDAKDYNNSIRWALNASNANSSGKQKSESFIIYAKSLYLIGKHDQAFEVLSRYISNTNSQEAIDALHKLKQGII